MTEHIFLYGSILLIVVRGVWEFRIFKGRISPLIIYTFCYFYFCFGPYIAHALNIPIYSGIQTHELHQASFVFFLAILALSITPSNILTRATIGREIIIMWPKLMRQTTLLLMLIPVCLIFSYAFMRIGFSNMDKVQRINAVGILHYVLLTLWPLFLFTFLTVSPFSSINKEKMKLYLCIISFYFLYCFYMGERDFALITIPIYFWIYQDKKISIVKLLFLVVFAVIGFTLMSAGRSTEFEYSGLGAFLNQGSNLMVTSNLLYWLDNDLETWSGMSYISSLINMMSIGYFKLTLPLSIWFSRKYSSAANDGAYGFSIEGEVLLNFGIIGIPIFFSFIAILISAAFKGYRKNKPFGTLMTYFILFYFIYAIRGESLIILKSFLYCCIIFFSLLYFSQRGRLYFKK